MTAWMVGVDTGGTFTDLIAIERTSGDIRRAKVPSNPDDPSRAVLNALTKLFASGVAPADVSIFVHGTTVATNALLEGTGVRAGLLITRGFRATYEARGASQPSGQDLLDTFYQKPPLLAPQWMTEEVTGRLDYQGQVVTELDEADLRRAVRALKDKGAEAIAVCFLFSFLNPAHERRAGAVIREEAPDCRVSLSCDVLPVIREYPRLSTTVIDAYVGPKIETYLLRLEDHVKEAGLVTPQLFLMQSNGGLMRISLGARHPNQTLLSGPAAGVIAGLELARATRRRNVITYDMGGTSTDISVISDGRVLETTQGQMAGQDIGTPMLRVRTLGAGGGTVAWIGKDGLMKVGPRSSGSKPGPACYGRGGTEPTVTDANLVLGALDAETVLAGSMKLDADAARSAVDRVASPLGLDRVHTAAGILKIVNNQMAVDLRLALQEQGQDPRKFSLVAFGGAGPLHAAVVAKAVGIPEVLVPTSPGLNCAMGMLQTNVRHSYLRSEMGLLGNFPARRMSDVFADLERQALEEANEEGFAVDAVKLTRLIDLRYPHQGYTLPVECPPDISDEGRPALKRAFDELHGRVFGQSATDEDAEIVTFRLQSEIAVPRPQLVRTPAGDGKADRALKGERELYDLQKDRFVRAKVYDRAKLLPADSIWGPAIIDQFDSTTVLPAGFSLAVDETGTLIIKPDAS